MSAKKNQFEDDDLQPVKKVKKDEKDEKDEKGSIIIFLKLIRLK